MPLGEWRLNGGQRKAKMNLIGLVIISGTTLFPAYQLFMLPDVADQIALFSQYLGLAALVLMAWGQVLSTRLLGIETIFGGLDRVYVLHKWAGVIAMAAILLHDTIDAEMDGLGRETALNEIAETIGELSLYGLLILVVISVATFIPYHLWKWTHKAMGALFAAGTLHFVFIMKPFSMYDPAGLYTASFCVIGLAAYFWMLLPDRFRPSRAYEIEKLEETGGALAISMRPKAKGIRPNPGQFGIFRFVDTNRPEPHPFSFSNIQSDGSIRVTIKALGDFTAVLGKTVAARQRVEIQGPFGRFRMTDDRQQIWIAGGIGITPFLTWVRDPSSDGKTVDLFFCVKSRTDAPHLEELEAVVGAKPNMRLHVFCSEDGLRLTADLVADIFRGDVSEAKVFFCGPVALRQTLQAGLRRYGVSRRRLHFEEFEFRTGIGFKRLATWLLN